jgi:hypothetical protein
VSEDEEVEQPSQPSRGGFLRFLRRLAIVVGIVVVVWVIGRWQIARVGERKLDATVERIEAAERAWKIDDIEGQRLAHAPPAERNSVAVIDAVKAAIPADWEKWRQETSWPWDSIQTPESNHLPGPERVKELRTHANSTAAVRELAHTLRDRPAGHRPFNLPDNPITMTLPHLDRCMNVVSLLHHDAMLAALDGDLNRAMRAAHAALNVSRSVGDEPLLISQLFRMSCRNHAAHLALLTLAWSTPTTGLAELQAALFEDAEEPLFLHGVRGERAALHKLFLGLESDKLDFDAVFPPCDRPPMAPTLFRAYRPLLFADHAECLRLMTGYVEAAKLPWHEQRAAGRAVMPDGPSRDVRHLVTRMVLPACDKMADAGLRGRARLLTTGLALACERFRQQTGRWPKNLEEIPKSILATVPVSPFDGRPIRNQVLPDGIAISCFCRDEKTNIDGLAEFREGDAKGFAEGARLWNPEFRGLPALPEKKEKDDP